MVKIDIGTYMPTDETMELIEKDLSQYNDKAYDNIIPIVKDNLMDSVLQLSILKHLNKQLCKLPDGLPRTLIVNDKTFVVMHTKKELTINII